MAKDLLKLQRAPELNLRTLLRPAVFVPESKSLNELLRDFRSNRNHLAIVIDEFGNTAGLITIEDVLEEIVGEIEDEFDEPGRRKRHLHAGRRQPARRRRRRHRGGQRRPSAPRCPTTSSTPSAAWSRTSSAACRGAARRSTIGGLRFTVMLTRGGAVRWFKVRRERDAGDRGRPRRRRSSAAPRAGPRRCAGGRCARRAADAGLRPHRGLVAAAADACAWLARRRRSPLRAGRAALGSAGLRHGVAGGRRLVAVHQHAPLRRPAGVAGRAGGARAGGGAVALPGAGAARPTRAGAAGAGCVDALLFAALLAAGRTGARRASSPAFPGSPAGYAQVDAPLAGAGALGRRLRHRRGWLAFAAAALVRCCGRRAGLPAAAAGGARLAAGAGAATVHRARRPDAERDAAADQRAAGREVRRRAHARHPGLGRARAPAAARGRPGGRARDRDAAAARRSSTSSRPATGMRCASASATAARPRWSACRWATSTAATPTRWSGWRRRGPALPLRQAAPGAVRRVHPARLPLVHRADEHPAGRLHARRAPTRRRSPCWASAWRPTSATKICSAKSWRDASPTRPPRRRCSPT